jgi:hypothetical protein
MGTILGDFTHIAGGIADEDGIVPVPHTLGDQVAMSSDFNTGGIRGERSVILMFSVIPVANPPQPAQADVYINEHKVGSILVTVHNMFTTQTIAIARAQDAEFKGTDGRDNVFAIKNVPRAFQIKDIVCFFHQES